MKKYVAYRNLFLQTPFPWPQTAGWLLCRSHMPEEQRQMEKGQSSKEDKILTYIFIPLPHC